MAGGKFTTPFCAGSDRQGSHLELLLQSPDPKWRLRGAHATPHPTRWGFVTMETVDPRLQPSCSTARPAPQKTPHELQITGQWKSANLEETER